MAFASDGSAQNVIPLNGPHSWLSAGETRARLHLYSHPSCQPECPDVRLTCETPGRLDISVFHFNRRDIVEWIAADDPFAGVRAEMFFMFNIDGVSTPFVVWNLNLNDYDTTWIAESTIYGDPMIELLRLFGRSEVAAIETPPRTITLAARTEDLANRATFVEACLAMQD
jgi:hypothetical protein